MSCAEIEKIQEYFSKTLSAADRLVFEKHLQECSECRKLFETERLLDTMLRSQSILTAPPELHSKVMAAIEQTGEESKWPDWLIAVGLGLSVATAGIIVGKYKEPILNGISHRLHAVFGKIDVLQQIPRSDWYVQFFGGSEVAVLNFLVAGVVSCWGLWQMVKALRN